MPSIRDRQATLINQAEVATRNLSSSPASFVTKQQARAILTEMKTMSGSHAISDDVRTSLTQAMNTLSSALQTAEASAGGGTGRVGGRR